MIFAGQRLFIPGLVEMLPTVIVAPIKATAGSQINVTIGGFPANTPINIRLEKKGSPQAVIESERVDANGNLDALLTIPATAHLNEEWVVMVDATDRSGISVVSNPLRITRADEAESGNVKNYIVKPGDTLSRIASQFDTSLSELLEDNPRVTNLNHLYVGERLSIRARNPM
jgi:LysM repeat protein